MKNIDGYVTKDSLYRLLSNMRMNREIDDNASSKVVQAVANMKPVEVQPVVSHEMLEKKTLCIPKGTLKARKGKYVVYDIDYLLENLQREIALLVQAKNVEIPPELTGTISMPPELLKAGDSE